MRKVYPIVRCLFLFLFLGMAVNTSYATHNRAGEITYVRVPGKPFTIRATVTTYTRASSTNADRDEVTIVWGDGTVTNVPRQNGPQIGGSQKGEILANDTKVNRYSAEHTYPGRGHYVMSMTDPNRNAGICNLNRPSSDAVVFHLNTTVTFLNEQFQGINNSPVLNNPPIDIACVGQPFFHNPAAYDPDGDSLAYRLIIPFQGVGVPVPNYVFPDRIIPGPDNVIFLNETTGTFSWNSPKERCEYNIAMYIIEFRNGIPIDTMVRDMQILVEECENKPPQIALSTEETFCVIAGDLIEFDVTATAPLTDAGQKVKLEANGAVFQPSLSSPAEFKPAPFFSNQPYTSKFRWQTVCEHISDEYYNIVFRAYDDFIVSISPNPNSSKPDTSRLSTIKTVRIKVVGPQPQDVQARPETNNRVRISWTSPYKCEDFPNNTFRGFSVWRRESSNPFPLDTCMPGLSGKGYVKLTPGPIKTMAGGRYNYDDTDVLRGKTYCYRVEAEFAKTTSVGIPYNPVEGLASEEVCIQLKRDVPLLTKVSVSNTNATSGTMELEWVKPSSNDLDTMLYPGPYRIQVQRGEGLSPTGYTDVSGASFSAGQFWQLNALSYEDQNLNTVGSPWSYQLAFYHSGNQLLGTSRAGSSVFLTVTPTDRANILRWSYNVPWENTSFEVYRQNTVTSSWDLISTTDQDSLRDTGLENGKEYCYYIRSIGSYNIAGLPSPLYNLSQRVCATPFDNQPPCPPTISVVNTCTDKEFADETINSIRWKSLLEQCPEIASDLERVELYYAPTEGSTLTLIATFTAGQTDYTHQPADFSIAGCYSMKAVDQLGNVSAFGNKVCVDNCPQYLLPNTFTPNGDDQNDLFKPRESIFIARVDFKVFNRLGIQVFSTTDPELNWDGKDDKGNEVAEGTYYYTCTIFENRLGGPVQSDKMLSGYIHLIRSSR